MTGDKKHEEQCGQDMCQRQERVRGEHVIERSQLRRSVARGGGKGNDPANERPRSR